MSEEPKIEISVKKSLAFLLGKYIITLNGEGNSSVDLPTLITEYESNGMYKVQFAPIYYGQLDRPLVSGLFEQTIDGKEYVGEIVISMQKNHVVLSGESLERKVRKKSKFGIISVAEDLFAKTSLKYTNVDSSGGLYPLFLMHVNLDKFLSTEMNPAVRKRIFLEMHKMNREKYFKPNPMLN